MGPIVALLVISFVFGGVYSVQYHGKLIGKLSELHHGVSGEVYAVDGRTLYIKDFTYDGQGPAAYFYAGTSRAASSAGFRLKDENGSNEVLRKYRKEGVTITLPEGKTLNNIKIFFVWCEEFEVNFGDVKIPRNFDYPRPQKIDPLKGVHAISSDNIVIVDAQTLLIPNLSYDGEAPDAKFWVGRGPKPSPQGIRVPDENGKEVPLRRYDRKTIVLTLPADLTVFDIGHFGIWCEAFTVDFGHVQIPSNLNVPPSLKMLGVSPQKQRPHSSTFDISREVSRPRGQLVGGHLEATTFRPFRPIQRRIDVHQQPLQHQQQQPLQHGLVSREIQVHQAQGFNQIVAQQPYHQQQFRQPVPYTPLNNNNNYHQPQQNFNNNNNNFYNNADLQNLQRRLYDEQQLRTQLNRPSKLNCEVLYDDLAFEVRWAVAGDSIVLQLVAKLDNGEYMSFGLSGEEARNVMIGGDVVVAWVDKETLKGYAEDYYLSDKSQCSGPSGSCPDNRIADNSNNIRLLNAAMVNGYSIVTYQRPLRASDSLDKPIHTNQSQAAIWAIGPLNQRKEVSFHSQWTKDDLIIDFGRAPKWNCPMPESEQPPMKPIPQYDETTTELTKVRNSERRRGSGDKTTPRGRQQSRVRGVQQRAAPTKSVPTPAPVAKTDAWDIPPIQCYEPEDGVFYAQMGPTGGKRGYPAITGHVGWGISWYINGLLIPEMNVVRGKTYTFVVEGGFDPEVPAKYHPFYITDDSVGGYEYKTEEEKKNVTIFAGVKLGKDGSVTPIGTGRLCHWTQTGNLDPDDFESFGAYQRTLELKCDQGEPGVIQWTPDQDTPDTVYYQCFTHRYLGWKINVHDSCETQQTAASESKPVIADLDEEASVRVETRVKPNDIINDDKKDKDKSTISETVPTPSIDPPQGHQLEPILIQPPQQSFFTPPIYTMSHHHGPFFTTYNPYVFDHPYHQNHHYQNTFKPSPLIDEDGKKITSTSTTEKPPPKAIEDQNYNKTNTTTTNIQIHMKQGPGGRPLLRWPMHAIQRPFVKFPPINRPLRSPPFKKPFRPVMRFPPQGGPRPNPSPAFPFKLEKPLFYYEKQPLGLNYHQRTNTFIALKPVQQLSTTTQVSSIEKEPEIQTAAPQQQQQQQQQQIASIKPAEHIQTFKLPPAHNTGFHPESVVIESGFKPIISKDFQRRIADESEELDDYEELGVITLNQILPKEPRQEYFEPVFVPSPEEKKLAKKRKKTPRSNAEEEPLAEAAERVESFYLPPPDQAPMENPPQQPSNLDIDSPGLLVTYDGKILSGASLTANIADSLNILEQRASKAAEFIKARPQFGPFKGELPPLGAEGSQLQPRGFLSRELDTPKTKLVRKERAAHHTPEHTEQQRQFQQHGNSNNITLTSSALIPIVTPFLLLIAFFVNFI